MLITIIAATLTLSSGTRISEWRRVSRYTIPEATTYSSTRVSNRRLIPCILTCISDTKCKIVLHDGEKHPCELLTVSVHGLLLQKILSPKQQVYTKGEPQRKTVKKWVDHSDHSKPNPVLRRNISSTWTSGRMLNNATLTTGNKSRGRTSVFNKRLMSAVSRISVTSFNSNDGASPSSSPIPTDEGEVTRESTPPTKRVSSLLSFPSKCQCTFPVCPNTKTHDNPQNIVTYYMSKTSTFFKAYDFDKKRFIKLGRIPGSFLINELAVDTPRGMLYVLRERGDSQRLSWMCSDTNKRGFLARADSFALDRRRNIVIYTKKYKKRILIKRMSVDTRSAIVIKAVPGKRPFDVLLLDSSTSMLFWRVSGRATVMGINYMKNNSNQHKIITIPLMVYLTYVSNLKTFLYCGPDEKSLVGKKIHGRRKKTLGRCHGSGLCSFGDQFQNDTFMVCSGGVRSRIIFLPISHQRRKIALQDSIAFVG